MDRIITSGYGIFFACIFIKYKILFYQLNNKREFIAVRCFNTNKSKFGKFYRTLRMYRRKEGNESDGSLSYEYRSSANLPGLQEVRHQGITKELESLDPNKAVAAGTIGFICAYVKRAFISLLKKCERAREPGKLT
jgi:hypothetical protein